MKCVNCSAEIEAQFCPHCGQPANVKRITFRQVFDDVQAKFLGLDNQFMRTVKHATIRPGEMLQAVLTGNRRRYIGAGAYLFLMLSLMVLLFDIFNVDAKAFFSSAYTIGATYGEERTPQQEFSDKIMSFVIEYMRLIAFLMLPIYALFSRFIFRKSGLNFMEHIALFCYIHAHPFWLSILGGILFSNLGISIAGWLFPISTVYGVWFFMDYFRMYTVGKRLLKSILVQIYSGVTLGLLAGVAAVIYVISTQP